MEEQTKIEWIELKDGKQFSRLLYTNPVCFLCIAKNLQKPTDGNFEEDSDHKDHDKDKSGIDLECKKAATRAMAGAAVPAIGINRAGALSNVMVLSWLTATNNKGKFMFSLNRRRYTASFLKDEAQQYFTLSVAVQGMEELVRSVGSVSGKWGSKFTQDHITSFQDALEPERSISKRQKKRTSRFTSGIPGLYRAVFRHHEPPKLDKKDHYGDANDELFVVEGTVAHLICRLCQFVEEPLIDEDHFLVLAEVVKARVLSNYWDQGKNLFRPDMAVPPYLTFFGSQTFGYVVPESYVPDTQTSKD